jgi:hypothetical protein
MKAANPKAGLPDISIEFHFLEALGTFPFLAGQGSKASMANE